MHAKDIITMPKFYRGTPKRKPAAKPPNWHLTSPETMKFIQEADVRTQEKQNKIDKLETIKKEAVKEARKKERIQKKKSSGPISSNPKL